MRRRLVAAVLAVGLGTACTPTPPPGALVADPYEGYNRAVHELNRGLDQAVLRPVTDAYVWVTPTLIRHLIGNAASHLRLPGLMLNQLMQGEAEAAAATLGRLTINTVLGAGGLLDPATEFGLPLARTDFGLTLARWGVGEGAFFEVPLFGPSTTRDTLGRMVDFAFTPALYLGGPVAPLVGVIGHYSVEIIEARDANRAVIEALFYDPEDSYIAVRTAYIQARRRQAGEAALNSGQEPDIFAE